MIWQYKYGMLLVCWYARIRKIFPELLPGNIFSRVLPCASREDQSMSVAQDVADDNSNNRRRRNKKLAGKEALLITYIIIITNT